MEDFAQRIPQELETKNNRSLPILLVAVLFLAMSPPAIILATKAFPSAQSPIVSPLSDTHKVYKSHTSNTSFQNPYTPSQYIALAQQYFQDAYTLAQIRQQTDEDKKEIVENLQKAIDTISEAINTYPNKSELWQQRASIYTAIQTIAPQAQQAAIRDLEQAQRIHQSSGSQPLPSGESPAQPAGLELIRDQQADSRDVLVAAPDEPTSPYQDMSESSASSGTAVIPAGQTGMTVKNTFVTDAAPIYVVPKTQTNASLSVVNKIAGTSFTVTLDNAQKTDVLFQYWVTK